MLDFSANCGMGPPMKQEHIRLSIDPQATPPQEPDESQITRFPTGPPTPPRSAATPRQAQTTRPNPTSARSTLRPPVTNPASLLQSRCSLGGCGTPIWLDLLGFAWISFDSELPASGLKLRIAAPAAPSPIHPFTLSTCHLVTPPRHAATVRSPTNPINLDLLGFAWICLDFWPRSHPAAAGLGPGENTDRAAHRSQTSAFELRFVQKTHHLRHLRNLRFMSSTRSP